MYVIRGGEGSEKTLRGLQTNYSVN